MLRLSTFWIATVAGVACISAAAANEGSMVFFGEKSQQVNKNAYESLTASDAASRGKTVGNSVARRRAETARVRVLNRVELPRTVLRGTTAGSHGGPSGPQITPPPDYTRRYGNKEMQYRRPPGGG